MSTQTVRRRAGAEWRLSVGVAILLGTAVGFAQTQQPNPLDLRLPPDYKPRPVVRATPMDTKPRPWTGARTPDGQPDVQGGIWAQVMEGMGRLDNPYRGSCFESPICPEGKNDPWGNPRPSRIVDPPDGRVPYLPWALARQVQQETDILSPTREEHLDPQARCLPRGFPRMNMHISDSYILQPPGYVLFVFDDHTRIRVIRLTDAPGLAPNVTLWGGESKGRWEGNTLHVETTNLNGKSRLSNHGDFYTDRARMIEKFVFVDANTRINEVIIEDPTVFTRPFTMHILSKRTPPKDPADMQFFERACWEGNYERPAQIDDRLPGR